MNKLSGILFPLLLMVTVEAAAQTSNNPPRPLNVTVCDLMSQPSRYSGKLIEVRGRISIAFEDFSLADSECPRSNQESWAVGVWLDYGGDERAPTIYCCGDHSRKPGEAVKVQGRSIPLQRDEQLLEFRKRISAQRQARPDGLVCSDRECYFYDVTATVTGHFFAQEESKDGAVSGYGHLGLFHMLFIEQVSDVSARRTKVPAGGMFDCNSEEWDVPASEATEVVSDYQQCHDPKSCGEALQHALILGTIHWGETPGQLDLGAEGIREEAEFYWSTPNLLTTYDFKFPYNNQNVGRSRSGFTVARTSCSSITKPLPQSAKVSCDTQEWTVDGSESVAKRVQAQADRGIDPWRLDLQSVAWSAVRDFAAKNSIVLSSNLTVESCDSNSFEANEFGYCRLISRDGMQAFSVSLTRYGALISSDRPIERTVWVTTNGSLSSCKVE